MRQLFAHRVPSVTVVSDMSDAMRFLTNLTVLASMTALCSAFLLPKSREDEDKGGKKFCITMLPTAREGNVFTGVYLSAIGLMATRSLLILVTTRSVRILLE